MKFVKLLAILFVVTLSSCEKEELILPKKHNLELPNILQKQGVDTVKNGLDTVKTSTKIKEKKKRKKFFLKKT